MIKFTAKKIAVLSIMTALLVCGKLALTVIPNVEVVSLFCGLFGYVFGIISLIPATIFCLIMGMYWGFNTWVLAYFIYFNSIVVVFWLLSKKQLNNSFIVCFVIGLLTFMFGVIDAFAITIVSGLKNFWQRLFTYYLNGTAFVIIHILSNMIIFFVTFKLLSKLLLKTKNGLKIN